MPKKTQVATILSPDGTSRVVRPANGKKFELSELQHFVDGYIELVIMKKGNGHATMYCNEEGKLKDLPINREATKLALAADYGDVIVGNAVVIRTETKEE